jgi:hypothetical protein
MQVSVMEVSVSVILTISVFTMCLALLYLWLDRVFAFTHVLTRNDGFGTGQLDRQGPDWSSLSNTCFSRLRLLQSGPCLSSCPVPNPSFLVRTCSSCGKLCRCLWCYHISIRHVKISERRVKANTRSSQRYNRARHIVNTGLACQAVPCQIRRS